jgi:hypothetical protein
MRSPGWKLVVLTFASDRQGSVADPDRLSSPVALTT